MVGKHVMVTGANSGIGKATAVGLARRGATVILVCRDAKKAESAMQEVRAAAISGAKVELLFADLSSLQSVRELAAETKRRFSRLDVLINNAGVLLSEYSTTVDGFETSFAVNHLAPFLLNHLLLDLLKASAPARILNVNSIVYKYGVINMAQFERNAEKHYRGVRSYSDTKLANAMVAVEMAKRLAGTGVTVNALHPGNISTSVGHGNKGVIGAIFRFGMPLVLASPEKGAEPSLMLATDPALRDVTGRFYMRKKDSKLVPACLDEELRLQVWNRTAELVGLRSNDQWPMANDQ